MKITINGNLFEFEKPCTILDACKTAGIDIPNLCFDPRTEPFTSCYLCVVEVEGAKGFVPSCATKIRDGLAIKTNTLGIEQTRKLALELLLSDHAGDCVAPCSMNCPAGIDIQSYLAYVANKDYENAIRTIKDRNPLPLVCGRVCPKPCETDCRRGLIDEAVAIDNVKRYLADHDANSSRPYLPELAKEKNKKVAIVGAGPAGLSCAYYLRINGYKVDVFEAAEKPGGMLMWGIPEYRLPKKTLLREVEIIQSLGVNITYNKALGKDFSIADLKAKYDAVFVAIGAQKSTKMQVINEETEGVYGGIDFLADVARGKAKDLKGKSVIVVGGGNTAIDAARTSVRLGAGKVIIVYRRTREEMPAEAFEVTEADHEGAEFKFLRAPVEVVQAGNKVKALRCQVMKLGEPDASGRRKPVAVEGQEDIIEADVVIAAIGQFVDIKCLEGLDLTRWQTIKVDEENSTYKTNIDGVFAGGDVVSGPYIAIGAIAHGLLASKAIDSFISKKPLEKDKKNAYVFTLGKKLASVNINYMPTAEKVKREKNRELPVKERLNNFSEVEYTFSEEQAVKEANRCLGCGCLDYDECKLRTYAEEYKIDPELIKGDMRVRTVDDSSKYFYFDSTKCIKCGKCIRVCDELKGVGALGFVRRGFFTDVLPAREDKIVNTSCVECGQCEIACPSGAILDKAIAMSKLAQFQKRSVNTVCKDCSIGCKTTVCYVGEVPVKIMPQDRGTLQEPMLCKLGRYNALEDYKASFAFDENKYKKLKLYDASINDIYGAINDAEIIINYNVDIFKFFAPVSSSLKRVLNKNPYKANGMYFYLKEDQGIYGLGCYPVSLISDQAKLNKVLEGGKKTLLIVDETTLDAKELDFFLKLKSRNNIRMLDLVKRSALTH
jgi:formate dehydrogenase major subunit